MVRSPLQKRLASALLLVTVAVQLNVSGAWTALQSIPAFTPLIGVQQADAQSNGNFVVENADPKYGKTWIVVITCRNAAGQNVTYNQGGNSHTLAALVRNAIVAKGLNLTQPQQAVVRSDGGTGAGFNWNDNSGTPHMPTVTAVCQILGNMSDTYVSSTCRDDERSGIYPNGKCNFHSPGDNNMHRFTGTLASAACQDGVDNDGDGRVDFPADPGCSSTTDTTENGEAACQDNIDNDGDGLKDFPQDPGCVNAQDNDEFNAPTPQCADGIDNDGDGATDTQDFSCSSPTDNDETNPKAACQDGQDNDGDGLTDFPADPGCVNRQDNDEFNQVQCTATRVTANFEGRQGPWEDVAPNGDATPPTFVSNVQAGGTVKVISANGTYSARIYGGQDQLPLTCDKGTLSFTNNANQTLSKIRLDSALGGVTVPNGATRAYLSHDEPGSYNYFDNSGNRDRRSPCVVTLDVTPNTCQQAQCSNGIDDDGDGLVDFPADPGCVNAQDNDESPRNVGNLDVEKVLNGTITPGQNATYTITVRNTANVAAQNVNVYDYFLDSQDLKYVPFTFVSSSGVTCSYQSGAQQVSCPIGTVSPNQTVTMTLTFAVPVNQACSTQIRNRVDAWINGQQVGADVDDVSSNVQCLAQCRNGIDDDGDGRIDFPADPGCSNQDDNTEGGDPACADRIDNDSDGLVDFPQDPGCVNLSDNDEFNAVNVDLSLAKTGPASVIRGQSISYTLTVQNTSQVQATNVVVTDQIPAGLTYNDLLSYSSCAQQGSNVVCSLGTINAGQNGTFTITFDTPTIANCTNAVNVVNTATISSTQTDSNTANNTASTQLNPTRVDCPAVLPQCRDGIDNDGDGRVDFPADPGCSNQDDNTEGGDPACADRVDNDNDGLIDFPQDPGCSSLADNDESNGAVPQCRDGVDNDGDGKIDALVNATTGAGGQFYREGAVPKYGKTWITTITCRNNTVGQNATFGNGDAHQMAALVSLYIRNKGLPYAQPDQPLVRSDGNTGGSNSWNDNGIIHMPTVTAVCQILGDPSWTYVSSTCADNERSGNYSAGKCNFHTPENNTMFRFNGTISSAACSDGIDNDNDGLRDFPQDTGCASASDASEVPHDPQCTGPDDTTEADPLAQCQDGIDNDGDGATDFPADFSCTSPTDNDETNTKAACQDGIDNDFDGLVDFPQDPGCVSRQDNDEFNVPTPQCRDGIDNDGDGRVDFPADPGCSNQDDTTEGGDPACADGIDNDSDGLVDFPQDPGCSSLSDTDEFNALSCTDGLLALPGLQSITVYEVTTSPRTAITFQKTDVRLTQDITPATSTNADFTTTVNERYDVVITDANGVPNPNGRYLTIQGYRLGNGTTESDAANNIDAIALTFADGTIRYADAITTYQLGTNPLGANGYVQSALGAPNYQYPNEGTFTRLGNGVTSLTVAFNAAFGNQPSCPITPQCRDGVDNDGDGRTDFPNDAGCSNQDDNTEGGEAACQDGRDNDADGLVDFPQDPGCVSLTDTDEFNAPLPACRDGIDNDNDGRVDMLDPGCSTPDDTNESDDPACADRIDNDNDGLVDFPFDPGCVSPTDTDEFNQVQTVDLTIQKAGPQTVIRGQTLFYSILVGNSGTTQATNVVVSDTVPTGLVYNDALSYGPCALSGNVVSCPLGSLAANQFGSFYIAFDTPAVQNCSQVTVTNVATISGTQTDSNPANNTSSTQGSPTRIDCPVQLAQCQDAQDNDFDGRIDFPADPGCSSPTDTNEGDDPACSDRIDNDNDGLIDFPQDPGCSSLSDTDEFNAPVATQCNDGIDNDGDGATDMQDFSCSSPTDNDETNPKAQCQDGLDNDNDGLVDFPQDPGCASRQDNDEFNAPVTQCSDGIDNDGDGRIDTNDAGCSGPGDTNEGDGAADLGIALTGPATVQGGSTATYVATVSNNGPDAATSPFSIRISMPAGVTYNAGLSSQGCTQQGSAIVCSNITLGLFQQTTRTIVFNIPGNGQQASAFNLLNFALGVETAHAQVGGVCNTTFQVVGTIQGVQPDPNQANNQSQVTTSVTCQALPQCSDGIDNDGDGRVDFPADTGCSSATDTDETDVPQFGCVEIKKETFDPHGNPLPIAAQFTFILDATRVAYNDASGRARFDNLTAGTHSVAEIIPSGWTQLSVSPQNGIVTVTPGTACAQVTFRNRQVFVANAQCSDGYDNDGDGLTDYPQDSGCSSATDNDEYNSTFVPQCSDNVDNDGDGLKDFPLDTGCENAADNNEQNAGGPITYACSDNVDNDGDGLKDFPQDPGCSSATDTDETNAVQGTFACNDNVDNDGDGLKDFPQDPGCSSATDTDEFNFRAPRCSDGVDNDGDGLTDYPQDTGCTTAYDDNEYNDRLWLDRWKEFWNWNW